MSLPILSTPKYTLQIPSTGKNIEFRPFLVKEEKILLLAQESQDSNSMINAIRDLISACTFEKVNINTLPIFDVEYIFIKIRAKSVGGNVSFSFPCLTKECPEKVKLEFNLDDIGVSNLPKKRGAPIKLQLNDQVGITLKYPLFSDSLKLQLLNEQKNSDIVIEAIASVIESVYDSSNVYYLGDSGPDEIKTFIESMNHKNLDDIMEFIKNTPEVSKEVTFTCPKCKVEHKHVFRGMQSFFQ